MNIYVFMQTRKEKYFKSQCRVYNVPSCLHCRQLGTLPLRLMDIIQSVHKKSSHTLSLYWCESAARSPTSTTYNTSKMINIYIMFIMSIMSKQGGLQLCTPLSHWGTLPLDCPGVQLLHQVQTALRLRHLFCTGSINLRIEHTCLI